MLAWPRLVQVGVFARRGEGRGAGATGGRGAYFICPSKSPKELFIGVPVTHHRRLPTSALTALVMLLLPFTWAHSVACVKRVAIEGEGEAGE